MEGQLHACTEVMMKAEIAMQSKYQTALREHTNTLQHMQAELEAVRASEKAFRTRIRDMELDNDDLEKSERLALPMFFVHIPPNLVLEHLRARYKTQRIASARR